MADFLGIRTLNQTAVPSGTDLILAQKTDGSAAAYTLDEIAAYIAGVTLPTWQTDAAFGCHLEIDVSPYITQTEGIIFFRKITRDSGFYLSEGTVQIPSGVTKVQMVVQVHTDLANPILTIVKNSDMVAPIAKIQGYGNFVQIVSPEISVTAGDILQVHCSDVNKIYSDLSYMNVRTIEKLT